MCLIAFALDAHPRWRLVLAANRDEWLARPAAPLAWWADAPDVLAGRDLQAGGTWMGVSRDGRFAALTNVREPAAPPPAPDAPSRGALVTDWLLHGRRPEPAAAARMAGFNLITGRLRDARDWRWDGNRAPGTASRPVPPGLHAISNGGPDARWPKTEALRDALAGVLDGASHAAVEPPLLAMLASRAPAPDAALPDTGIGPERERALSSVFVELPGYATRASSVLTVDRDGRVTLMERSVDGNGGIVDRRARFVPR